jgi:hypothetical protein
MPVDMYLAAEGRNEWRGYSALCGNRTREIVTIPPMCDVNLNQTLATIQINCVGSKTCCRVVRVRVQLLSAGTAGVEYLLGIGKYRQGVSSKHRLLTE